MSRNFIASFLAVASIFGTPPNLRAQYRPPSPDGPQAQQQYPQPGAAGETQTGGQQGVARLSIVQGDVNVKRGDSGDLVAAAINAPLVAQDHVQTSPGSRAEVQLDYANMIRLAPNTDLGFADLEYRRYQVQLGEGTIIYRVLRDSSAQAEVDTPSIAVRPTQQGDYRISVLEDGSTQITVRSGELDVYSPRGTQQLQAGRTMLVRGDSSDPEFQMADQIAPDQFDDWSANRDRELLASRSYQYVSPDIYGADDLDAYGNWVPSQYGNVWEPRDQGADWAPYSNGRWVSEPYYGWTWVDDAPWGWAPYHYGRWFDNPGHGWCWWPGSIGVSYSWSPALVGFFGWGGVSVGVGWGSVGWVALAPFEAFHPWWGGGFYGGGGYGNYTNINNTTINNINIVRNTNITNIYRNARVKGGCVTAPSNKFGGPSQHFGRATQGQLRNASLFRGQPPVTPTRTSRQFSNRQATPNPRLASAGSRQFFHSQRAPQSARSASAQQQGRTQPGGSRAIGNSALVARAGGLGRAGQSGLNQPGLMKQAGSNQAGYNSARRGQTPTMSRGSTPGASQNSTNRTTISSAPQQSVRGMPPNMRSQTAGRSDFGPSIQAPAAGWHRFGESGAQRGQAPSTFRGSGLRVPQNSSNGPRINSAPQASSHGMPPNMRSQTAGRSSFGPSTQSSAAGWHRFGEPGTSTGSRSPAQPREQSAWHSFGQPQRSAAGSYGGARPGSVPSQPSYGRSFGTPNYGRNYQSRPLGPTAPAARPPQSSSGYRGGYNYGARPSYAAPGLGGMGSYRGAPSMPHYSAPSAPHFSAPSAPRFSAPSAPRFSAPSAPHFSAPSMPHYSAPPSRGGGGGSFHGGGGAPHGGGGGSHGGGHSSSDGHRNR